jgi:hypothetical protein
MPGQQGGGGSFRFFKSEMEIKQLLVEAGFPTEGINIRREGRGCVIIRAVLGGGSADPPSDSERLKRARRAVAESSAGAPAKRQQTRPKTVFEASTNAAGKLADAVADAAADVAGAVDNAAGDVMGVAVEAGSEVRDVVEEAQVTAQSDANAAVSKAVTNTAAAVEDAADTVSDAAAGVKTEAEIEMEVEQELTTEGVAWVQVEAPEDENQAPRKEVKRAAPDAKSKDKKPVVAVEGQEEEVLDARGIDSYEWSDEERY